MLSTTPMKPVRYFTCLLLTIIFSACGGGNLNDIQKEQPDFDNQGVYSGQVTIDMVADPDIKYNENDGSTNIVLQFIPRTKSGLPLSPEQVIVELKINDKPIGVEDKLSSTAQELKFNVHYSLVLDASYSMRVNNSFDPMLLAARTSVQEGVNIWEDRPGLFTFQTTWFNSFIYSSTNTDNWTWSPTDISSIPKPLEGTRTKLYAAIDFALDQLVATQMNSNIAADNSQNIMLVFSDGKDTYSHFSNNNSPELSAETSLVTSTGAPYIKEGRVETTLESALNKMSKVNNLTVHVIGLGDDLDETSLIKIKNAGNGLYFTNPKNEEVLNLFDRVTSEFTTLQSHGVNSSLPAGEYKFSLLVKSKAGQDSTEYNFNFKTGDSTAALIAE